MIARKVIWNLQFIYENRYTELSVVTLDRDVLIGIRELEFMRYVFRPYQTVSYVLIIDMRRIHEPVDAIVTRVPVLYLIGVIFPVCYTSGPARVCHPGLGHPFKDLLVLDYPQ